nr:hypothetical protein [Tanacetum cinerariifolium]
EDVLSWPGNANMAFDLRLREDVLPWPGNANMAFDLRLREDVLPWPGNANMAFDLEPDLKYLLRPRKKNIFSIVGVTLALARYHSRSLRRIYNDEGEPRIIKTDGRRTSVASPTEDVLPWPGNANMAFDLQPTGDVLPWPDNANMTFDLRPTGDVLLWPDNANMAFDLQPDGR